MMLLSGRSAGKGRVFHPSLASNHAEIRFNI